MAKQKKSAKEIKRENVLSVLDELEKKRKEAEEVYQDAKVSGVVWNHIKAYSDTRVRQDSDTRVPYLYHGNTKISVGKPSVVVFKDGKLVVGTDEEQENVKDDGETGTDNEGK